MRLTAGYFHGKGVVQRVYLTDRKAASTPPFTFNVRTWFDLSATLVRLMAVKSGRSALRAANPGQPDMEVSCANKTLVGVVAVFVGRVV